jgi:hypothetical protein
MGRGFSIGPSWTCQESVENLGTPKLAWDKVQAAKVGKWPRIQKGSNCNCVKENSKCQWGHWPFLLVGESVATPLWAKCEGEAHTPKSGKLESSGTPKNLELEFRGQNTSHCGVLGVIGKVLKWKCPKWPRMSCLDIYSPSYGQKKGRESNWQFDSRPLKVGNRPLPDICRRIATWRSKALEESYNFGLDLAPIEVGSWEIWAPKVPELQPRIVSGLPKRSPGKKNHLDVASAESCRV